MIHPLLTEQAVGEVTEYCNRLAQSLVSSADALAGRTVALGAEGKQAREDIGHPSYSLHWLSPYKSDVWD